MTTIKSNTAISVSHKLNHPDNAHHYSATYEILTWSSIEKKTETSGTVAKTVTKIKISRVQEIAELE